VKPKGLNRSLSDEFQNLHLGAGCRDNLWHYNRVNWAHEAASSSAGFSTSTT